MPSIKRDYYQVLGVAPDADLKAIERAYHALALRYHPDRCKDADASEHFKEASEAYAVLSDPEKRQRYDARGFAGVIESSHFLHDPLARACVRRRADPQRTRQRDRQDPAAPRADATSTSGAESIDGSARSLHSTIPSAFACLTI